MSDITGQSIMNYNIPYETGYRLSELQEINKSNKERPKSVYDLEMMRGRQSQPNAILENIERTFTGRQIVGSSVLNKSVISGQAALPFQAINARENNNNDLLTLLKRNSQLNKERTQKIIPTRL
jgi:hypothetical protein